MSLTIENIEDAFFIFEQIILSIDKGIQLSLYTERPIHAEIIGLDVIDENKVQLHFTKQTKYRASRYELDYEKLKEFDLTKCSIVVYYKDHFIGAWLKDKKLRESMMHHIDVNELHHLKSQLI